MNITIVIPLFNPEKKSTEVIEDLVKAGYQDIILVNDGSDRKYTHIFESFEKNYHCTILNHNEKRGKGRAIKTAFDFIVKNRTNIAGVITVDGDEQFNSAESVKKCEMLLYKNPEKVILGSRNFNDDKVSIKSRTGNRITSFAFKFSCGIKINDSQTGLRAIPFKYLNLFKEIVGERSEYGTNMLIEIKNRDIGILEVPIEPFYKSGNNPAFFRTLRNTFRVYVIIFKYLLNSVMSEVIDLTMFSIIGLVLAAGMDDGIRLFVATAGARVVSSAFNFMFNRKAVFRSDDPILHTAVKYYTLCAFQMMASYGLLYLVTEILSIQGIFETVAKFFVDAFLFVFSFQIQRIWVFKKKKSIVSRKK